MILRLNLLLIAVTLFGSHGFAQTTDYNQPPNSSYLAEHGISPRIFNVLISPMYQEDARFHALVTEEVIRGENISTTSYEIRYNPFYEYGLGLELIVKDPSIYEDISRSGLKRQVGKTYEKFKKIRDQDVLSEEEVGMIGTSGDETVLGFTIRKEALPNYLKYLHKMQGTVHLRNGILETIEMDLASPAKIIGIEAREAHLVYYFTRLEGDGGYLLERAVEQIKGTRDGEPAEIRTELEIINYTNENGDLMLDFDEPRAKMVRTAPTDTLKVKLERSLPLLGNAARRAGYELPLPYGVDLFTHFQRESLGLEKIFLDGEDLTDEVLAPGGSSARAITGLVAARGDVWILPFVNVTLLTGYVYGTTDVNLALSDEVKDILGILGVEADNISASVDVNGPMLGGGFTVAGGYKSLIATVNAMYIKQFVKEVGTEVDAVAITPMVGVRFPNLVNVMVGGQYQIYDSNVSGKIEIEDEVLDFNVELRTTRWNWLVGLQRDFSNRWNGTIMVGFEPRPQATLVLGYRF